LDIKRNYKDILKVQLDFINDVVEDISDNLSNSNDIQSVVNHVLNYVDCTVDEYRIKVCIGDVRGFVSVDAIDMGHIRYKMDKVGLEPTSYVGLIRKLKGSLEEDLRNSKYFKDFNECLYGNTPYTLKYIKYDGMTAVTHQTVR